jgi:PLP dependent protein
MADDILEYRRRRVAKELAGDNAVINPPADRRSVMNLTDIADNLRRIQDRIAAAASRCGRAPEEITLLAITKTFPSDVVAMAAAAGQTRFGENRVQEAENKVASLKGTSGIEWHLVGHLQSNKAHRAAHLFDFVHSVDSVKVARKLDEACIAIGKVLPVLLQVDLGREPTKSGAESSELLAIVEAVSVLDGLRLDGLMTVPPFFDDPESARPFFARLRELRDSLEAGQPGCLGTRQLSMGMSHDFEAAILEGATIIRVGTALFGERPPWRT